jgi:hypothetical protein
LIRHYSFMFSQSHLVTNQGLTPLDRALPMASTA